MIRSLEAEKGTARMPSPFLLAHERSHMAHHTGPMRGQARTSNPKLRRALSVPKGALAEGDSESWSPV